MPDNVKRFAFLSRSCVLCKVSSTKGKLNVKIPFLKIAVLVVFSIAGLFLISLPVDARYHPGWRWRTARSGEFTIYYPEGSEAFARRVLSLGDSVHEGVSGYLGVTPRRCQVVLHPGTDLLNGYYAPFPNRICLLETPPATMKGQFPGSDIVRTVFTHEMAHYVHLTTNLGWFGALSRCAGNGLSLANAYSPGWIDEGIATYAETELTDGGRGRSSRFHGEMLSFSEERGLWSLSAAGTYPRYGPPPDRIYKAGYFMVAYLNREYGSDAFPRLARYQARHPLGGTSLALKHVTGKSPKSFYQEFLADFSDQAASWKSSARAERLPSGEIVLADPLADIKAHFWTEEGTIITLRRSYDRRTALVEVDPGTREIMREIGTGRLYTFQPMRRLPDGRLVFGELFPHPLGEGELDTAELVIFDPETRNHERLTRNGHVFSADRSPDGRTFVAARRNGMWTELVLLDSEGRTNRTLVSQPGIYVESPCWSPDGSVVAFAVKVGRRTDIATVDPVSGVVRTLFSSDTAEDGEPSFSPDGRWIVFTSNRSGVWNIHAWDRTAHRLFRLTSVLYGAGEPKVSPDGAIVSFTSLFRGVNRLCTIPFAPQSGSEVPVSPGEALEPPSWTLSKPLEAQNVGSIPLWEAYRPFIHAPYGGSDEDGGKLGMFFMGADPVGLNRYTANILYGLRSGRPGYDIAVVNRSLWPTLAGRLYDTAEEGNTPGSGKDRWFRERGGELSLALSVIHRAVPSAIVSTYRSGMRFRHFSCLCGSALPRGREKSLGIFGEFSLSLMPDSAPRDMVPHWGQEFFLSYERGLSALGGELAGHNTVALFRQYLPSVISHHGCALRVAYQNQAGLLHYNTSAVTPRGFATSGGSHGYYANNTALMSLEYHFPLWYTDRGIGMNFYHLYLLKGSFFVDRGFAWNRALRGITWSGENRTSVGTTLTTRFYLFSWLPLESGISLGYKTSDEEGFVNYILDFKGLN